MLFQRKETCMIKRTEAGLNGTATNVLLKCLLGSGTGDIIQQGCYVVTTPVLHPGEHVYPGMNIKVALQKPI